MKRFVLDANALMAYLDDRPGAAAVQQLVEERQRGHVELLMSTMNWGEVYYVVRRRHGEEETRRIMNSMRIALRLVDGDVSRAERAGELKARHKVGYADAYAAELAISSRATLVTSDPEFRKLGRNLSLRLLRATPPS